MKILFNFVKIIFVLLSLIFVLSLVSYFLIELNYGKVNSTSDYREIEPKTVAIVPGAAVYGNTPSPILEDRLKSALILYKYKKVKKILLSGDSGDSKYNELKVMINFMQKFEVKNEDIFVDNSGFRTFDTLLRAKHIYQIKDAIIVTQKFHQARASFIAEQLGIQVISFEADLHTYKDELKNILREYLARNLAILDLYFFYSNYKHEGQIFPIDGDGSQTWKIKGN